jgi:hypothetical protein
MKKISIVIISLFAFSFLSATALATSGACSGHGGVDCSAGAQANGNVVCNDGWTGSSVSYSSTNECQVNAIQNNYPVEPTCSLSTIQQQEKEAVAEAEVGAVNSGEAGSAAASALVYNAENTYNLQYSACQSQWTNYQAELNSYNSCAQNSATCSCAAPLSYGGCTTGTEYNNYENSCTQAGESQNLCSYSQTVFACQTAITAYNAEVQTYNNCVSSSIAAAFVPDGINAYSLSLAPNGVCDPRYHASENQCVLPPTNASIATSTQGNWWVCDSGYSNTGYQCVVPTNSTVVDGVDQCDAGYIDNAYKQCIPGQVPTSSQPIATTSVSTPITQITVAIPTSTATFTVNTNLRVGASGNDVISLQSFLVSKGFLTLPAGTAQGYFGNLTKKALVSFQASVSLPATGYCGPMTRAIINGS